MISSVSGVIEDVGENGTSTKKRCVGPIDEDAQKMNEIAAVPGLIKGRDLGFETGLYLRHGGFEVVDDNVRLPVSVIELILLTFAYMCSRRRITARTVSSVRESLSNRA